MSILLLVYCVFRLLNHTRHILYQNEKEVISNEEVTSFPL